MNGTETCSGDGKSETIERESKYLEVGPDDSRLVSEEAGLPLLETETCWIKEEPLDPATQPPDDPEACWIKQEDESPDCPQLGAAEGDPLHARLVSEEADSPPPETETCWIKEEPLDPATQPPDEPEACWIKQEEDESPDCPQPGATEGDPLHGQSSSSTGIKLDLVPIVGTHGEEEDCKPDPEELACEECGNELYTSTEKEKRLSCDFSLQTETSILDEKLRSSELCRNTEKGKAPKEGRTKGRNHIDTPLDESGKPTDRRKAKGKKTPYTCDKCEASFGQMPALTIHRHIHDVEETPCDSDKSEASIGSDGSEASAPPIAKRRKRSPRDEGKTSFNRVAVRSRHKRTRSAVARPFTCDECDASFSYASEMTKHERIHTGDKPYPCDVCDARFTQSSSLNKHKLLHTGAKPYACDACDARFAQNNTLTKHKRTHTGERPFECDVCGARFTDNRSCTDHKRIHTGEKPFACNACDAKFARSETLTVHKLLHTGEKPFACDECGARFRQRRAVTYHKRVHTGEKPYACAACHVRFRQRSHLNRHSKQVHAGEKP